MWTDIKGVYRDAWAFALAFPLFFLIPVLVEFAQHVVELQGGMYLDEAGARMAEADPLRLQFGLAKTLALLLPGYWFVRFIVLRRDGGDTRRAVRPEWPAVGLWLVIFALAAGQSWWSLFGPDVLTPLGIVGDAATATRIGTGVTLQALAIYWSAWSVAWPLGNARITPLGSMRIMHGSFWYAALLFVAAFLPLMLLHYGLAILAVVALPEALDWAAMAIDAIVVGFLALALAGGVTYGALRAAERKNAMLSRL